MDYMDLDEDVRDDIDGPEGWHCGTGFYRVRDGSKEYPVKADSGKEAVIKLLAALGDDVEGDIEIESWGSRG